MENSTIYRHAFKILPTPSVVVLPDPPQFTVVEANDAFLDFAQMRGEKLVERSLLQVLDEKADHKTTNWLDAFLQVVESNAPFKTSISRREMHDHPSEEPEAKQYHLECVPYFRDPDKLEYIVANITGVSEPYSLPEGRHKSAPVPETSFLSSQDQILTDLGSWRWDIPTDTVKWSDSLYAIYGVDRNSFKASFDAYLEMVHPDDRKMVKRKITQALSTKVDFEFEESIIRGDGEVRNLKSWVRVVRDEKGDAVELVGVCLDISESKNTEKRLIKSQKLLRNLVKELKVSNERYELANMATNEAIYEVDGLTGRVYWGNGFYRLFGYKKPPEPLNQETIFSLVHPSDLAEIRERFLQFLGNPTKTQWSDQFRFLKADQTYAYVEENGYVKRDKEGKPIRIVGAMRDSTSRKVAESKMQELHQELERNLRTLAISNAELEQFAYTISHDLQEPLRMITGFMSQLEKKYGHLLDEKGKQYVFYAVDGAKRMRQIILDLLDFSRAGRIGTQKEEVDLNELIVEVKTIYRRKISEGKATFEIAKLPVIFTSRSQVRLIFQNLISNSLTYQKEGIPPHIMISCEEKDKFWQFTVADNGIGIDQSSLDIVFILFHRLQRNDNLPGTGTGLAVAKKTVESLGGEIWIESKKGSGSKVHFTLSKENSL